MIMKKPGAVKIESALLFLLKLADESTNFILFPYSDASEGHPKCVSFDPPDSRFIDHDRPIEVWDMETTFKFISLIHNC